MKKQYVVNGTPYLANEVCDGFEIFSLLTETKVGKVERRTARGGSPLWHIVDAPDYRSTFATLGRAVGHIHTLTLAKPEVRQ